MISVEAEKKILELAHLIPEKKITLKEICRIVDCDPATVRKIILLGQVRKRKPIHLPVHREKPEEPAQKNNFVPPHGKFQKCECGRMVQFPCLACWLEKQKGENGGKTIAIDPPAW